MRKITSLILISLCFLTGCGFFEGPGYLPKDFKIVAITGGISPAESVEKAEINAKGEVIYYAISPKDRAKYVFEEVARFKINLQELKYLYVRIKENNFFKLKNEYVDKYVLDGSFAQLTVTANGRTHTVKVRNIRQKAFDNIMIAINLALPDEYRVIYNEICY